MMDRWGVTRGVEQPGWQSDGKQQQRIQIGMLAERVRPKSECPGPTIMSASLDLDHETELFVPEGKELVKRSWS